MRTLAIFLAALCMPAVADLTIRDAHIRESIPGAPNTAAFLKIQNSSDRQIDLIAAESDIAQRVELHTHINDEGVMRMRQVDAIAVPALGEVQLKPGGLHVMFLGLEVPVKHGEQAEFVLIDRQGARYPVRAEVRSIKAHQH